MINGDDGYTLLCIINAVDHPVLTAPGRVVAGQFQMQLVSCPSRILCERAVDELDHRGCNLLR